VKLKAGYATPDSVAVIEAKLNTFEHIDRIAYQKDIVSLVNENVKKASLVLLGLAIVLLIVSVALINNTVRLGVYSNRFLINTMKLVGATNWFIRKPYLLSGMLNGLFASLISLLMLAGMVYYIMIEFGLTGMALNPLTIVLVSLIVIVSGIVLTTVSSYFAVGRYLKMKTHDMYYA
jgi:cell division transport system permease protein